ncbi:hypothetical protein JB92DRAFT_2007404 [Gautieria morchelliformis]|nr:hypothetical protein JB92DRAFT_2007404 [Gautieria morchelliformis]
MRLRIASLWIVLVGDSGALAYDDLIWCSGRAQALTSSPTQMLFRSSTTTIATTPHGMIYQSAPKPGFLLPEVTEASIIAYTIDRNHTWIYGVMLVRPEALSHRTGCSTKRPARYVRRHYLTGLAAVKKNLQAHHFSSGPSLLHTHWPRCCSKAYSSVALVRYDNHGNRRSFAFQALVRCPEIYRDSSPACA